MGLVKWLKKKTKESRARPRPRTAKRLKEIEERKEYKRKLKEAYEEGERVRLLAERKKELELARKGIKPKGGWWQGAKKAWGKIEKYSEGVAKNIEEDFGDLVGGKPTKKKKKPKQVGIYDPLGIYPKKRRKKRR